MQQLGLVAVKEQESSNFLHRHVYFYHTFSLMAKHSAQHDSVQHEAKQISNAKQMRQHLAQHLLEQHLAQHLLEQGAHQ
jgi:Ser-tRNA(Ala) deacylase AlaX